MKALVSTLPQKRIITLVKSVEEGCTEEEVGRRLATKRFGRCLEGGTFNVVSDSLTSADPSGGTFLKCWLPRAGNLEETQKTDHLECHSGVTF